jgi:tetratricopeptide (TPR) repeat protein
VRRNRLQLEQAVADAPNKRERAAAWYRLGVFHDNNGREEIAIGCYEQAISLGLTSACKARALAWLASSLFKVGRSREAWERSQQAIRSAQDKKLKEFVARLQRRIQRTSPKVVK